MSWGLTLNIVRMGASISLANYQWLYSGQQVNDWAYLGGNIWVGASSSHDHGGCQGYSGPSNMCRSDD